MKTAIAAGLCAFLLVACGSPDRTSHRDDGGGGTQDGGGGGTGGGGAGGGGTDGGVLAGYIYAHTASDLYRVDTTTLGSPMVKVEKVGAFGFPGNEMTDLAVTPEDKIYGVSWVGGNAPNYLWEVDPDTGKATKIATVPGSTNVALTFDIDGTLLGADKSGAYRRIDPKTGMVTPIGSWGAGYSAAGDIVAIMDGTLYAISDAGGGSSAGNNGLVKLDPKTGAATPVGLIGIANTWGAGFWCGHVYAFTSAGEIIEIDTMTGKGKKIADTKIGWWGAGVTPRAPLGGTVGGSCK